MFSSFSFFGRQGRGDSPSVSDAPPLGEALEETKWPEKMTSPAEGFEVPPVTGLAAMVVQQSTSGPLAPPSRKLASYVAPTSAIAASLAMAAPIIAAPQPPLESEKITAPAKPHFNTVPILQTRELSELRMDLEKEIESVRQDLFGAAMGVSALKDRLEDLEQLMAKKPAASESSPDVENVIQAWLDTHLSSYVEAAVQRTLAAALEKTVASLSSHEFFRLPGHLPDLVPEVVFSQPPHILSSALT